MLRSTGFPIWSQRPLPVGASSGSDGLWPPRSYNRFMSEVIVSKTVVVPNPQGLHARPADLFVKTANRFAASVEVIKDGERVDGKSILGILMLVAEQGTQLFIEAKGHDAHDALTALVELVEQGFEPETVE